VTFPKPRPAAQEPVATTSPGATGLTGTTKADGRPFAMEVTGLRRLRRLPGGLGLLTYTITNEGSAETWFRDLHHAQDWEAYKYQAATDVAARRQYLPGRLEVPTDDGVDFYCACTDVAGVRISTEKCGRTRQHHSRDRHASEHPPLAIHHDLVPVCLSRFRGRHRRTVHDSNHRQAD
jgi:hypothetical protein